MDGILRNDELLHGVGFGHSDPNRQTSEGARTMSAQEARRSEERLHDALTETVLQHLASTRADLAYYEAALALMWEYGEHTPFEAACHAWLAGDTQAMHRALADENRLEALAGAAR